MLEYTEDSSLHDKLGICLARRELTWSRINKIFIKKLNDFSSPLVLYTEPDPRQVQSKGTNVCGMFVCLSVSSWQKEKSYNHAT